MMEYILTSQQKAKVDADPAMIISLLRKAKSYSSILNSCVNDFNEDKIKKIKIGVESIYFIDRHKNEWEVYTRVSLLSTNNDYFIRYKKRGIYKTNYTVSVALGQASVRTEQNMSRRTKEKSIMRG